MSVPALKLTTYLGERDRADGGFLADALADVHARHGMRVSAVFRGIEGFGRKHRLQTARLLTLSEDLPVVSVAVDAAERIEALLDEVGALQPHGLVTLERARLLDDAGGRADAACLDAAGGAGGRANAAAAKLTLWVGRQERTRDGRPAHVAVVDALHAAGVDGATVLLGVDGTLRGSRERAQVLSRNAAVPVMVMSVGAPQRIAAALPRIAELLQGPPLATLERVRVCKRDGVRLAAPHAPADAERAGAQMWQKLSVYASEQSRHAGAPLHAALVRRLREEGAAGATALRGLRGYHGDHAPHGERLLALRRRVPVLTVAVDEPHAAARWYDALDELTRETGLVTSELVRAVPAGSGALQTGQTRL